MEHLAPYAKGLIALVGAIIIIAIVLLTMDGIEGGDVALMVTAVLTAFGVYELPNKPVD